ncbi:hypothetical protein [Staphylococcus edaphicus]|uniref:Uncharacterized protein n=1 Tax=Staphylococcus edaphicus TaxID=1955013 RepID=A0A2C6WPJ4_9STAP|nr:hypothetical protein [Staphylococcus edaphicus]PHK49666.1 hypothetical protein BTJ66_07140 [Staphylococcus edaphicus]UQW81912.1 hypothetical protein MNY58_02005 [Staphylococcus edaphicus]
MKKVFLIDLLNLFFIALGYFMLITILLFSFDLFEIKTTGSVFLVTLSQMTFINIFNHSIFNGLFTLFLAISFILFIYKSIDLYMQRR